MARKTDRYAFPTEILMGKYRYHEINCYPEDFVGYKTMLKYSVEGYFNQTECAIALVARLTFLCDPRGWRLAGWKAYLGAWNVRTEEEAMEKSLEYGNQVPYKLAKVFFDFPESLYDTGW